MNIPLKQYWDLLTDYLTPQWRRVALLVLLLLGNIGLQLWSPQILRTFIDTATSGSDSRRLPLLAVYFIAAALVTQFCAASARYVGEDVGWTATNWLRADLASHCLRLDLSFHKSRTPGEIIERIDGDVNLLSGFFSQASIDLVGNMLLMSGVLVLLFREDWRIGLAMAAFAAVSLVILMAIRNIAVPWWKKERQLMGEYYGFVGEQLSGTEDVRSSGAVPYVLRRMAEFHRTQLRIRMRSALGWYTLWWTTLLVFALGNALAFAVGFLLYRRGLITIGTVYLIFHYTELLRRPMEQIRTQLQELQRATASIARVRELLATQSRIRDGEGAALPAGPLHVDFDNVSFAYEGDELVLQNIDFRLQPGRVLGLLGRTGSGKSSLARLLLRLYDPTAGQILLGGVPAAAALLKDLRRHVGIVTQDVQLFEATVRNNLTFFDGSIPDERITTVLDDLGLGPWLRSLPHGLDTELESGGSGLSAGEAQLLAFARLFLADPGLVILDEASSRLDPATEALIERAVEKLLAGRTGVIIAHRLGTVQRADEILILEDGRILEHGERAALAADPSSRFHRLLQTGLEEVLA